MGMTDDQIRAESLSAQDQARHEMVAELDQALHGHTVARDASPADVWANLLNVGRILGYALGSWPLPSDSD